MPTRKGRGKEGKGLHVSEHNSCFFVSKNKRLSNEKAIRCRKERGQCRYYFYDTSSGAILVSSLFWETPCATSPSSYSAVAGPVNNPKPAVLGSAVVFGAG